MQYFFANAASKCGSFIDQQGIVQILIDKGGANVNATDDDGDSALLLTAEQGEPFGLKLNSWT